MVAALAGSLWPPPILSVDRGVSGPIGKQPIQSTVQVG